jgi:transcriptional antiterminator RfaH
MNTFRTGWYLLYTKPNREIKVAGCLAFKKIQHYLPVIRKIKGAPGKEKTVQMPLFPSYIFIRLMKQEDYYEGCDTEGVCGYVKSGNQLVSVCEHIIDQLRISADKAESVYVSAEYFQPGPVVEVRKGSLSGLSGELVQFYGKQKILVRLNMLNRVILVDLPAENIPLAGVS